MTVLVLGATGATGRLVVRELISRGYHVKAIVRSLDRVESDLIDNSQVEVVIASIVDLSEEQLLFHVRGCEAVVSCLGHNITFKGIFGQPRRLVTQVTMRICQSIKASQPNRPIKFILMSTSAYQNKMRDEKVSVLHKIVSYTLQKTIPPHLDNEEAAKYLQNISGGDRSIEWIAVRPDSLIDRKDRSDYELYSSPISDPIFSPKKTSRVNVAHFMVELLVSRRLWNDWKNDMPVIYNI